MAFEVAIMDVPEEPLYQRIAEKVLHLHWLGLNNLRIGRHLDVDDKTVAKSLRWVARLEGGDILRTMNN